MYMNACATWCLRSLSLIYGVYSLIILFKPELLNELLGNNPKTWLKYITPDDVNNVILGTIGSLCLGISVICGYSATFINYGDKVKVCRGLSLIHCFMIYLHAKDALQGKNQVFISMNRLYLAIAYHLFFAVWTLSVAFSTPAAHQQHLQKEQNQTNQPTQTQAQVRKVK